MKFHTFGRNKNKAVLLIHGVLCPWQIWQPMIDFLQDKYYVIVPALDGHTEDEPTEFISVEREAEQIEKYVCENYSDRLYAICGLSMGATVSAIIFRNNVLKAEKLILDGAPLSPANKLIMSYTAGFYKKIIRGSRARDKKTMENCKKFFLPEKYHESYLKIADNMSESSLKNIIYSVFSNSFEPVPNINNTKILFLHGTAPNEMISKKSAQLIKEAYPDTRVICCKGAAHAQICIYEPEKWIDYVGGFINE